MTEETNRDVIWPIGLALSAALHAGGLYYIISHAKTPGATDVPTPAISVSLVPTKVLESISETGEVETAGSGVIGQGGQAEPQTEEIPLPEEQKPDPDAEKRERERAETEAREKAEVETKALEKERVKVETEARERAEAESREKAEAEAKAKALAEAAAREQAIREAKELAEAKEKADAEAKAKAEAEYRERAEAETREKAEAERQKLAEAKRRTEVAEEEARERAEEARERREEAERRKQQRSAAAPGSASSGNSERPSRPQSGRVSASSGELINYKARVRAHMARNLPRGRSGAAGNIAFNIRLTESGEITGLRILRSTGNSQLDAAALSALRRAVPYPRAPQGASVTERTFESYFTFR